MMNIFSQPVSVVIPLYNKEKSIVSTLESVLHQASAPQEIIVIDDGSTDSSAQRVQDLMDSRKLHSKLTLIRTQHGGASRARNRGIAAANGDYIAFLDAGDQWDRQYLTEIGKLIADFPECIVFATNYQKVDAEGLPRGPKINFGQFAATRGVLPCYFKIASMGDLPFITSSVCVSKQSLHQLNGFPEEETIGANQLLWSNLSIAGNIAYSKRVLSLYHLDVENRDCINNVPESELAFSKMLHEKVHAVQFPAEKQQAILEYTAAHLFHLIKLNILSMNFKVAKRLLSDSRCKLNWKKYCFYHLILLLPAPHRLIRLTD